MYLTSQEFNDLGYEVLDNFEILERRARRFLDYYTANRIESALSDYEEEIKECMATIIENEYKRDLALKELEQGLSVSRKGIKSESVTDHSVTFESKTETATEDLEKYFDTANVRIARRHLQWTGLLYRGL